MGRILAPARINIKAVVILVVVMGVLGGGVVIGHYVRKRLVGNAALAAGKAALDEENWTEACKHLQRYLVRYPDDVPMLESYARANLLAQPRRPGNLVGAQSATSRIV